METGYKKVLEKYVRKTRELVHIVVGGEKIVSTADHPYFVVGRGFINAGQLCIGSPLQNANGKILEVEQIYKEYLEEAEEVTVFNFQVEDWHTYHVGEMEVLVHNAGPNYNNGKSGTNSINSLDDLLTNPNKLSGVSGEELYNYLVKNGYDVKPLNRGSFKGIPFEEGGGFKVNWGGDRILQYHPENLSHHGGAYFKISSGETGTIRIDLDGNLIN